MANNILDAADLVVGGTVFSNSVKNTGEDIKELFTVDALKVTESVRKITAHPKYVQDALDRQKLREETRAAGKFYIEQPPTTDKAENLARLKAEREKLPPELAGGFR